ncbi:hypothetical protein HHL08_11825 [Sphingobium sp. AR-3-1]|uniref:Uncharacterized protein n=1 Tax=Sphingobium psychrophilum TaxID=2728834 RepID=A0A7X9ZU01_9SPHN|nr:hypothetical protein [Sphingobium psychrophilum]NML10824.1 hypothetical protein [Sphingobium psychrophilum]
MSFAIFGLMVAGANGLSESLSDMRILDQAAVKCGVADVRFQAISAQKRHYRFWETRVNGSTFGPRSLSDIEAEKRQRKMEKALPCVQAEVRAFGLTVSYPITIHAN